MIRYVKVLFSFRLHTKYKTHFQSSARMKSRTKPVCNINSLLSKIVTICSEIITLRLDIKSADLYNRQNWFYLRQVHCFKRETATF